MSNYYELLGVSKTASEKEIRQAYRRLARQHHPDVNKNDAGAEEKFKQINEAYSVLSDEDSRRKYDQLGDKWRQADRFSQSGNAGRGNGRWTVVDNDEAFSGFSEHSGMGGMFGDFFNAGWQRGRVRRPPPAEFQVDVTLEEAFHGARRSLRTQDGRTLEVAIPAGVDNGSRVRISPDGPQGADYYLVVSVAEHPKFRREGRDLFVDVDLQVEDAVLGAEILAPTLTGQVALTVPPNTPNERRFRLSGLGMPSLPADKGRGDLFVIVKLRLTRNPSDAEVELFRRLRELRSARPASGSDSF